MAKSNYVDNKMLYEEIVKYQKSLKKWHKSGTTGIKPQIPEYIGIALMEIANRFSHRGNFVKYIFREDMVCDAILACTLAVEKFNPKKSQNPFAYFTQIVYFAFLKKIGIEKDQLMAKYEFIEDFISSMNGVEKPSLTSEYSDQNRKEFMEAFNLSKQKKKEKEAQKKIAKNPVVV